MTAPDVSAILRLPGKLSHTPTDLTSAYPHGGTALGTFGKVEWVPRTPPFVITAWEWGGAPTEVIECGSEWMLSGELREWDKDALSALFTSYAAGAQGGPVLKLRANVNGTRAGAVAGDRSKVLVFTPDGVDDLPVVLFRRAVPSIDDQIRAALRGNASAQLAVRWYVTPDSSGYMADVGMRRDLTL